MTALVRRPPRPFDQAVGGDHAAPGQEQGPEHSPALGRTDVDPPSLAFDF